MEWLGDAYFELENYEEAETMLLRAVNCFKKTLGPTHDDTLWTLERYADAPDKQGKYTLEEPALREIIPGQVPYHPNAEAMNEKLEELLSH